MVCIFKDPSAEHIALHLQDEAVGQRELNVWCGLAMHPDDPSWRCWRWWSAVGNECLVNIWCCNGSAGESKGGRRDASVYDGEIGQNNAATHSELISIRLHLIRSFTMAVRARSIGTSTTELLPLSRGTFSFTTDVDSPVNIIIFFCLIAPRRGTYKKMTAFRCFHNRDHITSS